jgi:ABC-2 type transport system permease protein
MKPLLQAELIKLRTTRTFVALAAVAVGTSLVLTGLVSALTEPTEESVLIDVFASDTSSLFILILAVVGISGEWRHRTITSSLLAAPDRVRFLAAKTLAFGAAGVVLSLAISLAVAVVGYVILSMRDLPLPELGELAGQIGRNALVAALLGAFGVGVGALVRHQAVALVALVVVSFAVEPVLLGMAPEVGRFGPLTALPIAAAGVEGSEAGLGDAALLPSGLAALALLGWIAALYAAGAALLRHRDLN